MKPATRKPKTAIKPKKREMPAAFKANTQRVKQGLAPKKGLK